jgi:hypothetical protein
MFTHSREGRLFAKAKPSSEPAQNVSGEDLGETLITPWDLSNVEYVVGERVYESAELADLVNRIVDAVEETKTLHGRENPVESGQAIAWRKECRRRKALVSGDEDGDAIRRYRRR